MVVVGHEIKSKILHLDIGKSDKKAATADAAGVQLQFGIVSQQDSSQTDSLTSKSSKVVGSYSSVDLMTLTATGPVSSLLCGTYKGTTRDFRSSDQLFVSRLKSSQGNTHRRQRLSHWSVGAVASWVYASQGLGPPAGLRAHSTRGVATFWAFLKGGSRFRTFAPWRVCPRRSRLLRATDWCLHSVHGENGLAFLRVTDQPVGSLLTIRVSGDTGAATSHSQTSSKIL